MAIVRCITWTKSAPALVLSLSLNTPSLPNPLTSRS